MKTGSVRGVSKMLTDINIGQYIAGNSFIHRLDPRIKIVNTLLAIIFLFLISSFTGFVIFLAFTVFIIILSKISI